MLALDWNDLKVVIPLLISLLAIGVSFSVARASLRVSERARDTSAVNVFSALEDRFWSDAIVSARQAVAKKQLAGQDVTIADLRPILYVLELVGWNVERGILAPDLVWAMLGDHVLGYWWIFQPVIATFRTTETPTYYEHLASLVSALDKVSASKGTDDYICGVPTEFRMRFLANEAALIAASA